MFNNVHIFIQSLDRIDSIARKRKENDSCFIFWLSKLYILFAHFTITLIGLILLKPWSNERKQPQVEIAQRLALAGQTDSQVCSQVHASRKKPISRQIYPLYFSHISKFCRSQISAMSLKKGPLNLSDDRYKFDQFSVISNTRSCLFRRQRTNFKFYFNY